MPAVPAAGAAACRRCRRPKLPRAGGAGGRSCRVPAVPAAEAAACRRCRRPELPRMGGERPPHEQGAGVLRFRSVWGEGGSRRRQAHEQGLAACEPVVPTAGAAACRRCRRPELPRMGGERPPHEQGAGVLCFRSVWGEGGSRRRQAHEQGLAAYGVFGVCEVSGGMGARFPFAGRFCARERSRRRGYGSARRGRRFGSDVWGLEAGSGLFWGFGDLGIWGFGDLGIWGFGDLGIWGFGDLGIWGFGDLGIWGFGDLGIWGFGDLGIWGFGDLGIWGFGDLGIWGFGDLGIWGCAACPAGQAAHPRARKVSARPEARVFAGRLGLWRRNRRENWSLPCPAGKGRFGCAGAPQRAKKLVAPGRHTASQTLPKWECCQSDAATFLYARKTRREIFPARSGC